MVNTGTATEIKKKSSIIMKSYLTHIRELRNKIEKAVDRFTLGQINRDQLIANISGKTDYRSVDDYLDTELRNKERKNISVL